jgi:hypothetical protein
VFGDSSQTVKRAPPRSTGFDGSGVLSYTPIYDPMAPNGSNEMNPETFKQIAEGAEISFPISYGFDPTNLRDLSGTSRRSRRLRPNSTILESCVAHSPGALFNFPYYHSTGYGVRSTLFLFDCDFLRPSSAPPHGHWVPPFRNLEASGRAARMN